MVHLRLANLASVHPRTARLRKREDRTLRAVRPSQRCEMFYRAHLVAIVDQLRKAGAEIAEEMRPTWPLVRDASVPRLPEVMERASRKFGGIKQVADRLASLAAQRNLAAVDERLVASIRASVGLNIAPLLTVHGTVHQEMLAATRANVDLIVSIPAQYLDKVGAAVTDGFTAGLRWEELVKTIAHVGDVTDERAKLIARDQTGKMNSDFNRVRQVGLGIERYRWSGALDQRERPSHRAMEGQICRWDAPPMIDGEAANPGQPIQCRCVALPVFNLDELPNLEAETRAAA